MFVLILLSLLVIVPAAVAFLSDTSLLPRIVITPALEVGASIVHVERGVSTHPVPNAHDIRPSERGEFYYYKLINHLRVLQVLDDGQIVAVNRDRKWFCLSPNDSQVRKAGLIERLLYRRRFPQL